MADPLTDFHEGASLSAEHRIDAVCQRFEAAWKAGEQPRPDDFLTGWEGAERLVLLRELNLIDADYRRRAGETPSFIRYSHESTPASGVVPPVDEILPRPFGRYTLRELLGRGGMGRVYLAHDPQLDRLVALKMPNPVEAVGWRERFLTEARAAATLSHPNVCPVHDVGEVDGQPYLTMAYIEGETLSTKLAREGTFTPTAAAELVRTVARAMHEAHRRGIIHRDLKPANLMLDSASRPVIMDFGLAIRATATDDLRFTLTGVALGTPAYMPPEQAGGDSDSIGPSSDVYSLGVVLFEMLTGQPPFTAKSFGKLLAKIERDPPPAPSSLNPNVDPALEAITLTALAKSQADRFATAGELADALDKYLEGERDQLISLYSKPYRIPDATSEYRPGPTANTTAEFPKRRRRGMWLAGVAALLMAAVAGAVIYVETDYGQLVVQLPDPNAKVEVRVNGQEVTLDSSGGKAIRVRAGANHKLEVTGVDFETVADTYDVKRNGVTLARVTLVPKGGVAKVVPPDRPGDTSKKDTPKPDPVVIEPPKPVEFPKQSTLIEVPGWQILTDATKEQMQKWLDERKKDKHSVMWLDAVQVGDKPLFCAAAALDNRAPDWQAFLALKGSKEKTVVAVFDEVIDHSTHRIISISSYHENGAPYAVTLWVPGESGHWFGVQLEPYLHKKQLASFSKNGMKLRTLRPYLIDKGVVQYAYYFERHPDEMNAYSSEMTAPKFAEFLEKHRTEGFRPTSVAAVPQDGELLFAATMADNPPKAAWEVDTNLTSQTFGHKAKDMVTRGFAPTCITSYPWDGAVRYCVVWVKEQSKPVEYPKGPTLVEVPGWQILTNATKDEMQKWLDERKKAKHSVTWLDAMLVADKPLYSAAAALDDRAADWQAFLEVKCEEGKNILESFSAGIDTKVNWPVSISSYSQNNVVYAVALWEPGAKTYIMGNHIDPNELKNVLTPILKNGIALYRLRPYLIEKGVVQHAVILERKPGDNAVYASEMTSEKLTEFLAQHRTEGRYPTSLGAVPQDGKLLFAAAMGENRTKAAWEVDTDLTAQTFGQKAQDMIARGFIPASLTAYPWNGAVRYCVVWVKEPAKPVEYPKGPTLVEVPGWQILTDATKDEMQKWLDERKKDKHSVTWLDAVQVGDKPVFSAIAALDDRESDWIAFLDLPGTEANNVALLEKRINISSYLLTSLSGFAHDNELRATMLFSRGDRLMGRMGIISFEGVQVNVDKFKGYATRLLRPFPIGDEQFRCGISMETDIGKRVMHGFDMTDAELTTLLEKHRKDADRLIIVTAFEQEGQLRFAATFRADKTKSTWETQRGLTAAALKAKTEEMAKKGFRPSCVTAYSWDGAVRYCVVWVKEPPKDKEPAKNP